MTSSQKLSDPDLVDHEGRRNVRPAVDDSDESVDGNETESHDRHDQAFSSELDDENKLTGKKYSLQEIQEPELQNMFQ